MCPNHEGNHTGDVSPSWGQTKHESPHPHYRDATHAKVPGRGTGARGERRGFSPGTTARPSLFLRNNLSKIWHQPKPFLLVFFRQTIRSTRDQIATHKIHARAHAYSPQRCHIATIVDATNSSHCDAITIICPYPFRPGRLHIIV